MRIIVAPLLLATFHTVAFSKLNVEWIKIAPIEWQGPKVFVDDSNTFWYDDDAINGLPSHTMNFLSNELKKIPEGELQAISSNGNRILKNSARTITSILNGVRSEFFTGKDCNSFAVNNHGHVHAKCRETLTGPYTVQFFFTENAQDPFYFEDGIPETYFDNGFILYSPIYGKKHYWLYVPEFKSARIIDTLVSLVGFQGKDSVIVAANRGNPEWCSEQCFQTHIDGIFPWKLDSYPLEKQRYIPIDCPDRWRCYRTSQYDPIFINSISSSGYGVGLARDISKNTFIKVFLKIGTGPSGLSNHSKFLRLQNSIIGNNMITQQKGLFLLNGRQVEIKRELISTSH